MQVQKTLFIIHHLGLGDHIICNGMVRSLLDLEYSKVFLFCKSQYAQQIARLYADDHRIVLVSIPPHQDELSFATSYFQQNMTDDSVFRAIGFDQWQSVVAKGKAKTFDEAFYVLSGVPYDNRWDRFKLVRNLESEQRVFRKLNPNNDRYIFVHDDLHRGYTFDVDNPNNRKIIKNDPTESIFDMIAILSGAEEIHCMESSIRCFIDHLPEVSCPLYMHVGFRPDGHGEFIKAGSRRNWTVVQHRR